MDHKDFEAEGVFASEVPVKKQVIWKKMVDGKEVEKVFDILVLERNFSQMENIYSTEKDRMSQFISQSIVDEKGAPVFTFAKAKSLNEAFGTLLLQAINEVNGRSTAAKN